MPQTIADEFKSIPMSSNLGESLERAHRFAREQGHRTVTLEHLLLALTEDAEAALILQSANVDLARLRTDVSSYLGRLLEDMRAAPGAEPKPDPELLRVLQAAASAAMQSKRKQIDGAIVLAAVVGDGKSPAAGTLKAHGMTFEEAIRALQRANTQARLKPSPKPPVATPAAAKPSQPEARAPEPAPKPEVQAAGAETSTLSARLAPHAGSADDFLAAARARIQQRQSPSSAGHQKAEPDQQASSLPTEPDRSLEEALEVHAPAEAPQQSSNAFEELLAVSAKPETGADPYPQSPDGRQGWAPAPDMRSQPQARPPQGPGARGARQQPMPNQRGQRPGPAPSPGAANRPARAPWPEPGEHMRPPGANGSYPGGHYADGGGGPPQPARPIPAQHRANASERAQGDRGPLVESVPRRMRVGSSSKAEVRVSRDRIEGLVTALNGQGGHRPGQVAMRALSVRLKAPNGGFWIEPISPETQWVDSSSGLMQDDYAIWRWNVTPQRRGRGKLLLSVSARTIGQDGLPAESAPPDKLIEVRVAPNRLRRIGRVLMWLILIGAGIAIGRNTDKVMGLGMKLFAKLLEF